MLLASRLDDATTTSVSTRSAAQEDASIIHGLYLATPAYFDIISIPIPTLAEVERDLATVLADPRRNAELVLLGGGGAAFGGEAIVDPATGKTVAGYLDYKLDYPDQGDATVNLLLILPQFQSQGIGGACATHLEERLRGKTKRMLASIYGENPRARSFWERLGYEFAIDAKPLLDWYAKSLT